MATVATDKDHFRDTHLHGRCGGQARLAVPQETQGQLYSSRKWVSYGLLALLFAGPFLRINGLAAC